MSIVGSDPGIELFIEQDERNRGNGKEYSASDGYAVQILLDNRGSGEGSYARSTKSSRQSSSPSCVKKHEDHQAHTDSYMDYQNHNLQRIQYLFSFLKEFYHDTVWLKRQYAVRS